MCAHWLISGFACERSCVRRGAGQVGEQAGDIENQRHGAGMHAERHQGREGPESQLADGETFLPELRRAGGTPVIVRPSDGAVVEGYRSASDLKAFLNVNPKNSGA